jgi:hypothetical protein
MFTDEEEKLARFRDLTEIMEKAPRQASPEGFTARVMARLPEQDAGLLFKLKRALTAQAGEGFNFGWAWEIGAVSKTECSFYFFITGFFYLIIGIVAMMGLKEISSAMAAMDWIGLQPHLALGTAIWLFALGVVLMLDGSAGIKAARYGTLFYIFSAVVNGILMRPYLHIPYAGIFIIGLVVTSALMGVMLALAVKKMELRPV